MSLQRREKPHRVWMNQRKDSALTFFRTPLIPLNCMHTHIYTSTRRSEQRHTPALQSPPPAPVCATQVTAAPHPRPDSTAMPLTLCLCPSPSFHPSYPLPKSPHLNTFRIQGVAGGLQVCRLHYLHAKVC